jgi:hypothetical protein
MLPPNLYARVRTFYLHCTRDRGCGAHPVFPAPSQLEGGRFQANLGQNMSRDREVTSLVGWVERSETHRPRHRQLMGFASLYPSYEFATCGALSSPLRSGLRGAHKSCRVSRPCGIADRAGAFFAGVSPPVSAITETETTRSTMASTSSRSHWPSDSFVSRSFSRMV